MIFAVAVISALVSGTLAAPPLLPVEVAKRSGVTAVAASTISSYKRYTQFASAAYCTPAATATWTCGANCNALPGFKTYGSGGDGDSTQYWYVGYDKTLGVVVGHQGTDPSSFESDLVDAKFFLENLDTTLFPGVSSSVQAHDGFVGSHSRSAPGVLAAVQKAMAASGSKHISIVGHSLGGALALLDAVYLPLHLPAGTTFTTRTYGMPRVGNPAFASYVDAHVTDFVHINNKEDLIPILPGRFLGYAHPNGEQHILDSGAWVACAGHDNEDSQCTTGDVGNIFEGSIGDHSGPYDGVTMGC